MKWILTLVNVPQETPEQLEKRIQDFQAAQRKAAVLLQCRIAEESARVEALPKRRGPKPSPFSRQLQGAAIIWNQR